MRNGKWRGFERCPNGAWGLPFNTRLSIWNPMWLAAEHGAN
jgi:hypothetical protein